MKKTIYLFYCLSIMVLLASSCKKDEEEDGDATAPVMSLVGDNPDTTYLGVTYTDPGATAVDNVDGNITAKISASSNVDINTEGTYMITYSVADMAGNSAVLTRVVEVIENTTTISTPPSSFTKKVMVEEFTGAWCGYCPDGAYKIELLEDDYPGQIIATAIHYGDGMEISQYATLDNEFDNSSFPAGMVDRVPYQGDVTMSRSYWDNVAADQLGNVPDCGLAIKTSVSGTTATVEVHAAFNTTLSGDIRLTVYVIEDAVTGSGSDYDQVNYYDGDASSPFFGLGDPIVGYEHDHVLRKVASSSLGDAIASTYLVAGGEFTKTYTVNVSAYDQSNTKIIAFVNLVGTDFDTHEILNVQEVELGGVQNWD